MNHKPPSRSRSKGTLGVTRSVLWDSGVVLGKFLEHLCRISLAFLQGKKVVELGSGFILTDLADRLRMLRKNVGTNLYENVRGSAASFGVVLKIIDVLKLNK
ncbi:hypothetical protein LOK49_LG15G02079 [Camellia lanceoleosa]|uniref:Uncharacterized protein n=1 Tax=Camellia lanceoleosa TaxID=1840588 RepID=A0ACC0F5T4_9ERIC|nr:hypothetical protein LOK49_LG15G02079 [Camellia lanceoleosa]